MREQTGIDIDVVGRDTPMVLCRFDSDDDGDTWTMEDVARRPVASESLLFRWYADYVQRCGAGSRDF